MPSSSQKQHDLMVIAAKDPEFAKKVGIKPEQAQEFLDADKEAGLWQNKNIKSLTKTSTPEQLLKWMNKHLTYHGVNKGKVLTPEEVIDKKKAHCWESSELAYHDLEVMGFKVQLLYLQTKNVIVTHITTLYKDNNKWYWFEWAWNSNRGIHGPYKSFEEGSRVVIDKFIEEHGHIDISLYGQSLVAEDMSELDYFKKMEKEWIEMKNLPKKDTSKSILHKWK